MIDASVEVSVEAADDITTHQEALPGLRALRDAIKRDLDVLEKVGLFDLYVYYISFLLTVSSSSSLFSILLVRWETGGKSRF